MFLKINCQSPQKIKKISNILLALCTGRYKIYQDKQFLSFSLHQNHFLFQKSQNLTQQQKKEFSEEIVTVLINNGYNIAPLTYQDTFYTTQILFSENFSQQILQPDLSGYNSILNNSQDDIISQQENLIDTFNKKIEQISVEDKKGEEIKKLKEENQKQSVEIQELKQKNLEQNEQIYLQKEEIEKIKKEHKDDKEEMKSQLQSLEGQMKFLKEWCVERDKQSQKEIIEQQQIIESQKQEINMLNIKLQKTQNKKKPKIANSPPAQKNKRKGKQQQENGYVKYEEQLQQDLK